jgi:acetolactate synthase-1/2/3 large subunit
MDGPTDVPASMNAAICAALSGRKGPAALSICWDQLGARAPMLNATRARIPIAPPPATAQIEQCVRLIRSAKQPMIFTGSGAQSAAPEVHKLAAQLGAPVVGFRGGRGVLGEDQPLGLNMAAAWKRWPKTDLMIGIGTRLEIPFMRWGSMMQYHRNLPGKKLIRIDIDPAEMQRLDTDGPLVSDAAAGVAALGEALDDAGHQPRGDLAEIAAAKARSAVEIREIQPQMAYLDAIREVLPRDGFFVEELSQMGFTSNFGYPVYEPRTYVSCGYQGTLGFGFPTALGVKVAHPDKAVVSVTGDGGFMFAMPELATAVQYGINVVTMVFDNACYGNVRRDQETGCNNHVIGADLVNPDFSKLAESFGMRTWRADSPLALRSALSNALALNAPALIHVRLPRGSETSPWKFIHAT